ncbi:laminin subunit alpha-1 [Cricetulus griseus]|nr:laminin subunit alpha-1 [Cricetulus griseus]
MLAPLLSLVATSPLDQCRFVDRASFSHSQRSKPSMKQKLKIKYTYGLFPAILNLATNAHISANATCGEMGPEMFCKLVEHVPGRPVRHSQCRVCDERHPISHAIDGTNNWWQSPSIQNGREYHWVTITLDLRQVFQVAYIIIKAANAPRPGNWILERSVDGIKFKPWQYYAVSDTECLTRYKITPRRGPPTYRADNEVICTSYYSKLVPLEHGEIHTSLINGRPSADDPSPMLLEFTSARYIRLRLQRIRTLNADLMTLSHRDLRDLDPIVTRRQLQCQCAHNTCGESCDRCCPGYHQQPWRPGTIASGNECEECNCHNKAKDCYYDENVAKEKRSLNTAGQYLGGGVCINCLQNTTGINCETCLDQYYRPHTVSPYEDQPCRPCDCDPVGSLSAVCIKDDLHSDLANGKRPGQCPCKEGYAGVKCDRCQFGYRGFPNCIPCDCYTVGSVNDDPCSEPCVCKENVEGKNCDHCKSGFYNLQERNPQGCSECFCFGVSDVCDSLTWSVSQVTNMSGWLVTDLISPNMIQSQQDALGGRHQISINNTAVMQRLRATYYWAAPEAYLGNKLTAFGGFLKYTVSYDIPVETVDSGLMSHADVIIKGNGLTLSTQAEGLSLQPYEEYFNMVRLVPENFRDFKTKREIDRDQLMTVLANVTHLLIRANYNSARMALYRLDSVSLDIASPNAIDLAVATDVEHCECPQGYTGTSCEACNCSVAGSTGPQCDVLSGQCHCKEGFGGQSCDQCALGYRRFPDCVPCDCDLRGTLADTCDLEQGLCSCTEDSGTCSCKITLASDQPLLPVVSQSNLKGTVEGVHFQAPDTLLDAEAVRQHVHGEPFYWRLPKQFEGDQLLAYGGKLQYSVAFYSTHGTGTSNYEPQVLVKGGRARKHVIYMDAPAPENGARQDYQVQMKEEFWKYFNSVSEEHVTHSDFMSVLSNIEYILIKASYGQGLQQSRTVLLGTTEGSSQKVVAEDPALCWLLVCPAVATTTVMSVTQKLDSVCFSPTCVLEGDGGFRCNACIPGYEGQYCERCSVGYHGNPRAAGGSCQKCDCNPQGSVHSDCDPCDDECVGTLLSDLDTVGDAIQSLNLSGVSPAPYGILSSLENTTKYFQRYLLKENAKKIRVEIQLEGVAEQTENLQKESLHHNISSLLELIKKRNFTDLHQNATLELKAAKDLLSRIQKRFQKPQERLQSLKAASSDLLSNHSKDLQAAEELLREAETKTQESNLLLLLGKANLKEFREKTLKVQEERNLSSELITKGREWVDSATTHVDNVQDTLTHLERHRDELLLWTGKLRTHVDELVMQMSKRRARDLVHSAEQHASELQSLAGVLDRDLENVRNVSLNATSAAQVHANIQLMMEEAERLAAGAHRTSNKTGLVSESLVSQGKAVLQRTSRFLKESINARRKQQGITLKLDELKNLTSQLLESVDNITSQTNSSLYILREIPGGMREKERKARELAAAANENAMRTLENVLGLSLRVVNTSADLSRVNATVQETNDLLRNSTMTTLLAGRKMKDMETQANLLFDRLKPLKTLEENLSRNLSEIKLLISRARKQAASIKVAVSADRDCIRAYQPQISSTNYNTLTLNVKTQEPDNLLFYLGSSTSSDFLAVEMRRGKVAFLWDLGSGSTRLEFPDVSINDNRWHSIYITRFGNVGSLSVKEISSAENPPVKTSKSPGMANVLDINNSTLMFVGGLGGQIKKSPAVKITHFKGCMGEAFLNGKSIGLWNYIEREGKCNGCFGSSQNEDSSFHFDGSGYAVVEKTLRTTVTQIIILFSTFSPNGLLFYLASNGTKDFLSIELVRGRVKVMVDLGSGPLTLMTDRRYNNGTWYKIAFQRNRKQGLLAVFDAYDTSDKETKQGETPGASSDLNRLDKDLIYVGGLPHSVSVRKGVSSRSYVGCIKNLEISRSTFDLLRNSYGVKKGCALEPIQSVSFLRGGYVEVPPKSLSPESSLLATFTTKNSSGIILAALGKDSERAGWSQAHVPFFSIMLMEGHIEVHVSSGDGLSLRKALLHSPAGSYSDGQEHSISLVRNRRVITIQMDESSPVEMKLGPLAEGKTINISNLYIGGLPGDKGAPMLRMRTSFHGCIKNLVFDTELLDFTHAIGSEQVELDICLLAEEPTQDLHGEHGELPPDPPTLPQPELCTVDAAPGYVPGAHQFGLSQNSHLVLPFNHSDIRKRLQVQLSIRTFASSGLIYYVAHQNQMDYAVLQLHGGRLHFMFDLGKGRTKVSHPALLSDGKWHTVKTEYIKRKGFMTVDGQESPTVTVVGNATTLDVDGKLYLGGLPVNYRARNIGNTTHSIPACIKEVTVNGKQLDKDSPMSAFAVDRCYAVAQEGTFFEGSGYAALVKEGYRVRLDLNITLEFRTSSKNGVLLGISSAKVDAIGLEIVDGKVLFHVNNGAGRITATYEPRASRNLCDGKWHTVQAQKIKHRIVLTVDGNAVRAESPHTHSTSADTNDPIYVGGYPAHVKQNCLTSKTSFRGCVRSLKLTRGPQVQSLDLSRAFDLQGVFPHSCPGPES